MVMNDVNDSKWSARMLMTWAILIDCGVVIGLFIVSLLELIPDMLQLVFLTIISWFRSMSSIFRRWKNRLRCSTKRSIQHSRSSIFTDNDLKTVNVTMDRLVNENRILKERLDKLDERCQRWIGDEQTYLLKRIEHLENENRQLHDNYRSYQRKSEKCLESVTDLMIKMLLTQEELRKQCSDIHNVIDTVQLRKKVQQNESIIRSTRSISCQFTSHHSHDSHRHTTNDQSTWVHQQLMIVEENDHKRTNQPSELHVSGSQSSVYSPAMATSKYKSGVSSTGLTNELYFDSHKPDGDNEKTPPVLMRNKRRSPCHNSIPIEGTPVASNNRRPISSPVRSTTYVLQQHHRVNNHQNSTVNQKHSSPVAQHQPASPVILNKTRQQRTYSNHERLPTSGDSPTINQQLTSRAHITLIPRRISPVVKSTPAKTTTYISRSPRIPNTPPVRPSRPTVSTPSTANQQRSPHVQVRSRNFTPTTQQTQPSPSTAIKSIRPQYRSSKSPEPLRAVTGTVTCSRPAHTMVNKSKIITINNSVKTRAPAIVVQPTSTPRVSDLDALMTEKHLNKTPTNHIEAKSAIISPSPMVNNIRRSLFSADSVKLVRPVRSQELKLFSCHLTTQTISAPVTTVSNELCRSNIDETPSTLTSTASREKTDYKLYDNQNIGKIDDSCSNTLLMIRDLSEDSLNEHYHIRQLLKSNISITAMKNDSTQNSSSNDDLPVSSAVTSWSRIRSSCESNLSHVPPLKSETSASPAFYNGPVRQENIQMASDGRYFLLIDDNLSSEESQLTTASLSSSSLSIPVSASPIAEPPITTERRSFAHRLVFPERLGRIVFYRRTLSDSDIYQKLFSKDNEIKHNVYHLDTIRDYAMEFYMLTTYGSDSQLRAWFDSNYDDTVHNTCYFDDNRFQSLDEDNDDDDDDDDDHQLDRNRMNIISSSDSIIPEEDLNRLQANEELDWYSELESFNLSPTNQQWKHENLSSCSSEDHVEDLLRAEQFSVSSLTTTTSAESSESTGLISASWPLANGIHYPVRFHRSSQSLGPLPSSKFDDQSNTILKEILTYPWTNEISDSNTQSHEIEHDPNENGVSSSSVVSEEFQPDFYYLCPLRNTTSFLKTDEKTNGIDHHFSHDV